MGTESLNLETFSKMNADMNEQKSMLSNEQINAIAQKANSAINLPLIGEKLELTVFAKIVKFVDMKLYELLPNEYYELVNDASNGINGDEAVLLENRLSKLINEKVNIPLISEEKEEELINLIISQIVRGLISGAKLEEAPVQ